MYPSECQTLDALEEHVFYEFSMFVYLKTLNLNLSSLYPEIANNAVIESYLLHSRIVNDFFSKDPIRDDISCSHYSFPISKGTIPSKIEDRFNKCLAHLTYSRLNFKDGLKPWVDANIFPPLARKIHEFSKHILLRTDLNPTTRKNFEHLSQFLRDRKRGQVRMALR